jgi:hemerythrin-like domain-containing protein
MRTVQPHTQPPVPKHEPSVLEDEEPVAHLASEHGGLRHMLARLSCLADDLHMADREQASGAILDYLSFDLLRLSADSEHLAQALVRKPNIAGQAAEIRRTVRRGHERTRELVRSVIDGLRALSTGGLPDQPQGFAVAALKLCEHARRHTDYEAAVLLPLAKQALTPAERDAVVDDSALARGAEHAA